MTVRTHSEASVDTRARKDKQGIYKRLTWRPINLSATTQVSFRGRSLAGPPPPSKETSRKIICSLHSNILIFSQQVCAHVVMSDILWQLPGNRKQWSREDQRKGLHRENHKQLRNCLGLSYSGHCWGSCKTGKGLRGGHQGIEALCLVPCSPAN